MVSIKPFEIINGQVENLMSFLLYLPRLNGKLRYFNAFVTQ